MNAKIPTPQLVSALLKKAGFTRSQSSPSRIKGLTEHSEGYVVRKYRDDLVAVMHRCSSLSRGGVAAQVRENDHLNAYTKALEAAGFRVERDQVGYAVSLIISAKEA